MDIRDYYRDIRVKTAELEAEFPDNVVHVTSVYHREKNSTAGSVSSATPSVAARVLVDGTHRLSTPEEIQGFLKLQERNRITSVKTEQMKKQQYVVVVDPNSMFPVTTQTAVQPSGEAAEPKRGAREASK